MYLPLIGYFLYYSHDTLGFSIGRIALVFFGAMFFWSFLSTSCIALFSIW